MLISDKMKSSERRLLVKDLCARIPYSGRVEYEDDQYEILGYVHGKLIIAKPLSSISKPVNVEECKPVLRSLSTMEEEEKKKILQKVFGKQANKFTISNDGEIVGKNASVMPVVTPEIINKYLQELYLRDFDVNGLIGLGLAIER